MYNNFRIALGGITLARKNLERILRLQLDKLQFGTVEKLLERAF